MASRPLVVGLFAAMTLLSGACVENRFESIALQAASSTTTGCTSSTAMTTTRLSSYAFRVETCAGPKFYRCWYKRKTVGRVQCCSQVANEDEATATFFAAPYDPPPFCGEAP